MCVCVLPPLKLSHLETTVTSFLLLPVQTRSLLSVFEEDAGTLTDYTNQLLQAMQRVYGAQVPAVPSPGEEQRTGLCPPLELLSGG